MTTISITVEGKVATPQGSPSIVCGNSDYRVEFTFDSEWAPYTAKTARFNFVRNGIRQYYDVLFDGLICDVPVLDDTYEVEIGVYAGDIHTSTPARVPCIRSATSGAAEHPDPPADVYEQLMAYLAAMRGTAVAGVAKPKASRAGGVIIGYAETED